MFNSVQLGQGSNQVNYSKEKTKAAAEAGSVEEKSTTKESSVIVELGSADVKSATYSKPVSKRLNSEEIKKLWEETDRATATLRKLVEDLILRQGKSVKDVAKGKEKIVVDDKAKAEAGELISENGEWGVKAVSERIVNFAISISGGDKSKLSLLKGAIEEGFKQAEKAFEGELPEISKKTHDEIMKKLDEAFA